MISIRLAWKSVALALAAVIAVAAGALSTSCDGGSSPGAGGGATGIATFETSPQLALDGSQGQIIFLDMTKVRGLSFYQKAKDALLSDEKRKSWWDEFVDSLGMSPLDKIDKIMIALHGDFDREDPLKRAVVLCVGDFGDQEGLTEGFRGFMGSRYVENPPPFKQTSHNGVTVHELAGAALKSDPKKSVDYNFAFPSNKLMLFGRVKSYVTQCIDVMQGKSPNIMANEKWRGRLVSLEFSAAIWGLGEIPESLNKWVREHVNSDADLKGLVHLDGADEFRARLVPDKQEYVADVYLITDKLYRINGIKDNLLAAREKGAFRRLLVHYLGEGSKAIPVWENELINKAAIFPVDKAAHVSVRLSKGDAEKFIDHLMKPPEKPADPSAPSVWKKDEK